MSAVESKDIALTDLLAAAFDGDPAERAEERGRFVILRGPRSLGDVAGDHDAVRALA